MLGNHETLDNAQAFFNDVESEQNINLGVGIFLLKTLSSFAVKKGDGKEVPAITLKKSLHDIITSMRIELSKTNFQEDIAKRKVYYRLKEIAEKLNLSADLQININDSYLTKLENLLNKLAVDKTYYQAKGKAYAAYANVGLWDEKRNATFNASDTRAVVMNGMYRLDNEFKQWPINKMGKLKLYAAYGPKAKITGDNNFSFYPASFFEAAVNTDIQHVIAIGNPGKDKDSKSDFPEYFTNQTLQYKRKISANEQICVSNEIKESANNPLGYKQYDITCHITNSLHETYQKGNFTVYHISVEDGNALIPNDDKLVAFHQFIADALQKNEGVLVHCQAGLGRTGQFICEQTLLSKNDKGKTYFDEIFSDDNVKNIQERIYLFIQNQLRKYRPGLILQPEQLLQAFKNVARFLTLTDKQKYEETIKFDFANNKVTEFKPLTETDFDSLEVTKITVDEFETLNPKKSKIKSMDDFEEKLRPTEYYDCVNEPEENDESKTDVEAEINSFDCSISSKPEDKNAQAEKKANPSASYSLQNMLGSLWQSPVKPEEENVTPSKKKGWGFW